MRLLQLLDKIHLLLLLFETDRSTVLLRVTMMSWSLLNIHIILKT